MSQMNYKIKKGKTISSGVNLKQKNLKIDAVAKEKVRALF